MDLLRQYLSSSRNKLVDLTKRNKLINFNLNAKHPRHLDIVSVSLSQIWEAISSGCSISISFVPEPKLQIDSITGEYFPKPKAIDYAKELGINPCLELSVDHEKTENRLTNFQTLLYYPDLERFIQKLKDNARVANEEKGISTLHCMVGFLRWIESKDSSIVITSPLLLSQVELEVVRQALPAKRFLLTGHEPDQDAWVVNPSLKIKLQNDYGIELPSLEPGEYPASYFKRVHALLSAHPKWSISYRVAIGNIAFPRLALYEDLDPQKWEFESGNLLFDHPVLTGLLSGTSHEPSDQEIKERSEDGIASPIKGLVFDADSSQIEAIRRVLDGETMVLEGPPGTGKSQTIANLISAYLSRGKRVLFVTDKRAAIEVVEKRLAKAGLNNFCLNLHSDNKQSKEALYDKLLKRLELPQKIEVYDKSIDQTYQETISTVSNLTNILDRYYDTLRIQPEKSSSTLGDLLWTSLLTRDEYDELPTQVKQINIPSALNLSPNMLEISRGLLTNLETTFQILDISQEELRNHILWTFEGDFLDPFRVDEINQYILSIEKKIGQIIELLSSWHDFPDIKAMSLEDCLNLEVLSPLQDLSIDERLYKKLMNNHDLPEVVKTFRDIMTQFPGLTKSDNPIEYLKMLRNIIKQKIAYLKGPIAEKYGNCCSKGAASLKLLKLQLNQYSTFLAKACPDIYARQSNRWIQYAQETQIILECTESLNDQLIQLIRNGLSRGLDWEQVALVSNISRECDRIYSELKEIFCTDLLHNHSKIEQLSTELLATGYFKRFGRKWKRAYQCLSEHRVINTKIKRRSLLDHLTQLQKWSRQSQELRQKKIDLGLLSNSVLLDTEDISNLLILHEKEKQLAMHASSVYPEMVKSGRTLLDIQSISKSCFGDHSTRVLSQLCSYLNDSSVCHIEDLIQQIKTTLETTESLSKSLEMYCLNDDDNSIDLHLLCMSLDEFFNSKELVTLISNWSIENIIHGSQIINNTISGSLNKKNKAILASINLKHFSQIKEVVELARELIYLFSSMKRMGFTVQSGDKESRQTLIDLAEWQKRISLELPKLTDWWKFRQVLKQLKSDSPLAYTFVKQLLDKEIPLKNLPRLFDVLVAQNKVMEMIRESDTPINLSASKVLQAQLDFKKFDHRMIEYGSKWSKRALLSRKIYLGSRIGLRSEWTGLELIHHELGKQKKRIPPRKLLKRSLPALLDLMPCFMMSLLNAAQYLPASQSPIFDLVIIDEASQLKPEEALSSVIRGTQLLVVGDSKQLPPMSFFGTVLEDDEINDEDAIDNESILDMTKAIFPSHSLRWHYRSKHDSLIYFSNQQFYDGRLIVCPSSKSESELIGVHLIKANGVYQNGENLVEAELIIEKAVMCMKIAPNQSIGIVAMNKNQQELIQSLLYKARHTSEEVDSYLESWEKKHERCFVKNLENVQGDERDIILISTVYGPAESGGKVLRRFGPINSAHGHRRLNVLCTRARACMYVITSLQPSDILPPGEPSSKGVESFSKFLEFAGSGQRLTQVLSKEPDSPFEEYVGKFLSDAGYDVHYQIGQSGFRIDIGIRHPIYPYGFIAGIECDGASYHSHKAAIDRDRLRQEILENHGWKIYRIWSTDWFHHLKEEKKKLLTWLSKLIEELSKKYD